MSMIIADYNRKGLWPSAPLVDEMNACVVHIGLKLGELV
jgi:hypothetical protein